MKTERGVTRDTGGHGSQTMPECAQQPVAYPWEVEGNSHSEIHGEQRGVDRDVLEGLNHAHHLGLTTEPKMAFSRKKARKLDTSERGHDD